MAGMISSWTEAILLSLVFVTVLTLVLGNFNIMYNQNHALPISDNTTEQLFINYQDTAQQQIKGGEVDFNSEQGITLKSSYGLTTDAIGIAWNFLSGGWIEQIASMLGLGASGMALARALRILYFLSLVFGLLYALFKIVI